MGKYMTKQDILDVTVEGIRKQGKPSVEFLEDGGIWCLYRGPSGEKCALGFHIPDDEYLKEMETLNPFCCDLDFLGWISPYIDPFDQGSEFPSEHVFNQFLSALQDCHDDAAEETWGLSASMPKDRFLAEFELSISELAEHHGLRFESNFVL